MHVHFCYGSSGQDFWASIDPIRITNTDHSPQFTDETRMLGAEGNEISKGPRAKNRTLVARGQKMVRQV